MIKTPSSQLFTTSKEGEFLIFGLTSRGEVFKLLHRAKMSIENKGILCLVNLCYKIGVV